jgi:hypothetical protein
MGLFASSITTQGSLKEPICLVRLHLVDASVMTSNWRKHVIICLFLGLLAIPIYFMDRASMGGGGGNWITLDFRGVIFWTYITLLAIHITLSSIGVLSFPNSGALRIHLCSMVLSVILLIAGFVFYGKLLRAQTVSVDTLTRLVGLPNNNKPAKVV